MFVLSHTSHHKSWNIFLLDLDYFHQLHSKNRSTFKNSLFKKWRKLFRLYDNNNPSNKTKAVPRNIFKLRACMSLQRSELKFVSFFIIIYIFTGDMDETPVWQIKIRKVTEG